MSLVGLLDGGDGLLESDVTEGDEEEEERGVSEDRNDGKVGETDEKRERDAERHRRLNGLAPVDQIDSSGRNLTQEAAIGKREWRKG